MTLSRDLCAKWQFLLATHRAGAPAQIWVGRRSINAPLTIRFKTLFIPGTPFLSFSPLQIMRAHTAGAKAMDERPDPPDLRLSADSPSSHAFLASSSFHHHHHGCSSIKLRFQQPALPTVAQRFHLWIAATADLHHRIQAKNTSQQKKNSSRQFQQSQKLVPAKKIAISSKMA